MSELSRGPATSPDAEDLLFATLDGTPISRTTFRPGIWLPAIGASGVGLVRVHDVPRAHAKYLHGDEWQSSQAPLDIAHSAY
jgi:hypothetical protein